MNCHDVSLILDTRDIRRLTTTEMQSVETHLHGCAECAGDWQTHQRLLGGRPPEMASDLPARIWSSLEPAASTKTSGLRSRRTLVLGSLLLIGAAAAMIGWQSLRDSGPDSPSIAIPVAIESDVGRAVETISNGPVSNGESSRPESTTNQDLQKPAIQHNPPRHKLIVLPPLYQTQDSAAMEYFKGVYGTILGELRLKTDLEIVEVAAQEFEEVNAGLPPSPPPGPAPQSLPPLPDSALFSETVPLLPASMDPFEKAIAVGRHFGGEFTLRVSFTVVRSPVRTIDVVYSGPSLQENLSYLGRLPTSQADDTVVLGTGIARRLYARLLPDSGSSQYLSIVKSPRESDTTRLEALNELLRGKTPRGELPGLTEEMIEAAVELSRSGNPETRRQIWQLLGRTATPASLQALGRALRSEPDSDARREAANSLFKHASDPAIRAEFELAATADTSAEVRSLAKLALLPDSERSAYVLATVRDRSLTYEARMTPLMIARRENLTFLSGLSLDEATLAELKEIAEQSSDRAVKSAARRELGGRASGFLR